MTRLTRERAAFLRALQISRAQVHIFVEGKDIDRYFYASVADTVLSSNFDYNLITAEEIDGTVGGKTKLVDVFQWMRRRGDLVMEFMGNRAALLFYLDKDIDDLTRRRLHSPHLIYTRSYDVEGEVFRESDLEKALSVTMSLPPLDVHAKLLGSGDLRHQAMLLWLPWIEYCVSAKLIELSGVGSYGALSLIHDAPALSVNPARLASHRARFASACAAAGASDTRLLQRARSKVVRDFSAQNGYGVFKGKWFSSVLKHICVDLFGNDASRVTAFEARVTAAALQSIVFTDGWLDYYRAPLRAALAART